MVWVGGHNSTKSGHPMDVSYRYSRRGHRHKLTQLSPQASVVHLTNGEQCSSELGEHTMVFDSD